VPGGAPGGAPPPDPYQLAIRLIGPRAHSEAELRRKLVRRGCEQADVDATVGRLRGQGYLDDDAYARGLVARRSGGRGATLIAAELKARGIDREVAERALSELDRDRQLEAARRLVERSAGLEPPRLAARMQRRGFAAEIIRAALPPTP
jgi:regulatory protein